MTTTIADTDSAPTALLDRISLVLDSFDGPGSLTLAQVAQRTGLPRSTTHRMLERLVSMRWIRREGRHYELGLRLMELGSLAVRQNRLYNTAVPIMRELNRVTGHMVQVGILDGPNAVFLEQVGPRDSVIVHSRTGRSHPAHQSPVGLALLANSPMQPQVPDALAQQLARIREAGVAYLSTDRFCGLGVPIGGDGETPIAAISICAPVGRLKLDHRSAAPVRMAANSIMLAMRSPEINIVPTLQRRNQLRQMPTAVPDQRLQYA